MPVEYATQVSMLLFRQVLLACLSGGFLVLFEDDGSF